MESKRWGANSIIPSGFITQNRKEQQENHYFMSGVLENYVEL